MNALPRDFRWLNSLPVLFLLIALVALLAKADHAYAGTFTPSGSVCLDSRATLAELTIVIPGDLGSCGGDSAPGAATSITGALSVPKGDVNFSVTVNFIPPEWGVPAGDDIPDAAIVGQLNPLATLGLINGSCSNVLFPVFILMDATVDNTGPQVTFDDSYVDGTGDGVQDGVTKYPDFLNRIFDNTKPRARLFGHTVISGVDVTLNFVIFEPGTKIRDLETDPALGYPNVTILQNAGDPDIEPSPGDAGVITDFCTPLLTTTITFGTTQDHPNMPGEQGGFTYRRNPTADGTYNFIGFAAGQIDTDGDGIENTMDTCPFTLDPTFDPRVGKFGTPQPGDSDGDRIPDSCDENVDTGIIQFDTGDGDGYTNAGDNCPQVANGLNEDNQKDSDDDNIGDACDIVGAGGIGKGPNVRDGDPIIVCGISTITVGSGGTALPAPDICTENFIGYSTPPSTGGGDGGGDGGGTTSGTSGTDGTGGTGGTGGGDTGGGQTAVLGTVVEQLTQVKQQLLESPVEGLNLTTSLEAAGLETLTPNDATVIGAICADENDEPIPGADITFKIESQPGSDADLDGEAEVTKPADDDGFADTTLNVGSTVGNIVVSASGDAAGCTTKTVTVTVAKAVIGPDTGVGSLAPAIASIPAWAAAASAFGGAGLLGSLGALAARIIRRRRE